MSDATPTVPANSAERASIPAEPDELPAALAPLMNAIASDPDWSDWWDAEREDTAREYAEDNPHWASQPPHVLKSSLRTWYDRKCRYEDWDDCPEMGKPDTLCADGSPLLRSGALYTIVGDWSAGKSSLAVWATQEARDGHHVLWVDYEYQRRELRQRLAVTLGLSPVELGRVHYAAGHDAELDELMSDAEHWNAALVVIDAFTGLHDVLGSGSQNDADKVERTLAAVRPFTGTGASVLVIDHNNRNGESLGSQRKMSGVDAAFTLKNTVPFADGVPGQSELSVVKPPRDGSMLRGARIAVLDYDGETFAIHGINDKLRTQALGQMTRKLARMVADDQEPTRRELLRSVTGNAKDLDAEVKSEIADQVLREAGY